MKFICSARAPSSSPFRTSMRPVKSPAATRARKPCASRTGVTNDQEITKPHNHASTTAATAKAAVVRTELRLAAAMLSRSLVIRRCSVSTRFATRAVISPSIRSCWASRSRVTWPRVRSRMALAMSATTPIAASCELRTCSTSWCCSGSPAASSFASASLKRLFSRRILAIAASSCESSASTEKCICRASACSICCDQATRWCARSSCRLCSPVRRTVRTLKAPIATNRIVTIMNAAISFVCTEARMPATARTRAPSGVRASTIAATCSSLIFACSAEGFRGCGYYARGNVLPLENRP